MWARSRLPGQARRTITSAAKPRAPQALSRQRYKHLERDVQSLAAAKTIVLKSIRTDIHGRYLADLFFSDQSLTIDACFHHGHHLNELLIEAGHAVPWS